MPQRCQDGYSLVEMFVIVVIIGALAAIAIATYLTQARQAHRASAVSVLSNMNLAAESIRAQGQDDGFLGAPSAYEAQQGAYEYVAGATESTGTDVVSVHGPNTLGAAPGPWVSFAVRADDRCYYLRVETGSDALFQSAADIDGSSVRCRATEYATGADTGWD